MTFMFIFSFIMFVLGFGVGVPVGLKLRGHIPLRVPSNQVRVENAKADVEIAELDVQKARAKGELEYLQMEIQERLTEKREELHSVVSGLSDETVGVIVQTERRRLGWSQKKLSTESKIPIRRISEIENDFSRNGVTTRELQQLAEALDIDYQPPRLVRVQKRLAITQ